VRTEPLRPPVAVASAVYRTFATAIRLASRAVV
jgi:hypothetical protein